jgi:hypothetical protein
VATTGHLIRRTIDRDRPDPDARVADVGMRDERELIQQWALIGGACGVLAMAVYTAGSAVELTTRQEAVVATVFGPAIACASMGLYLVLRLRRRTVSLDLGLVANVAAGVAVTLMLMAQLGLKGWFELEFGDGATDSTERAMHAAFEAANGIQLGLDVAWDVFLVMGTVLLAVNMWHHPRFGRAIAAAGIVTAVGLMVINLLTFPEPPGHAGGIDLGPFIGSWYVVVSVRLLTSRRWVAQAAGSHQPGGSAA